MKREDLAGLEFDWCAVDRDDHVAIFSTAGWGEVPTAVLEAHADIPDDREVQAGLIQRMPRKGEWRSGAHGPGKCSEWKELGTRGIYVFDWRHWSGPYERIVVPEVPTRLFDVPEDLQRGFTLVRMTGLCFAGSARTIVEGVGGRQQEQAAQQAVAADGRSPRPGARR